MAVTGPYGGSFGSQLDGYPGRQSHLIRPPFFHSIPHADARFSYGRAPVGLLSLRPRTNLAEDGSSWTLRNTKDDEKEKRKTLEP